jgi:predicted acetyltransferase
MLALGLEKAAALGLCEVFVSCCVSNDASRKIIEGNGGSLVGEYPTEFGPIRKYRFALAGPSAAGKKA